MADSWEPLEIGYSEYRKQNTEFSRKEQKNLISEPMEIHDRESKIHPE
jgi:hypothetical protein